MSRPKIVSPLLVENCNLTDDLRKAVQGLGFEMAYVQDLQAHMAACDAVPDVLILEPSLFHWEWLVVLLQVRKSFPGIPVVLFSTQATVDAGFSKVAADGHVFLANDIGLLRRKLKSLNGLKTSYDKRVLFVDDDEAVLNAYGRMLRRKPWKVIKSTSGEKALAVLAAEKIDLVVTDIKMPDMHGLALISRIRSRDKQIPIVVSSGYSGMKDDVEFRYQNIAGFIEKPATETALHAALSRILDPEEEAPSPAAV